LLRWSSHGGDDEQRDPDKVLKKAVEKTIEAVAGPRDAEVTVQKVVETVDNGEVKGALDGFDVKRERGYPHRRSGSPR
jgi:hypothetical protein